MATAGPRLARSSRDASRSLRRGRRIGPLGSPRNRSRRSARRGTGRRPIPNSGTARFPQSEARRHGSVFPFSRTGPSCKSQANLRPAVHDSRSRSSPERKSFRFPGFSAQKPSRDYIRPCLRIDTSSQSPRTAVTKKPTNPTTGTPCQSGGIRAWMISALAIIRDANTIEKAMRFVT